MADNDKITELANRIYALDEKVYKATGSNLGRVYQGNKEKCINAVSYTHLTLPTMSCV